ncbi:MAG: ABC transporter substrate-binding protein [Rhodobacterales bacterium]|nr:ABC transporter substrate-binding protein [Rhodobacterales bacterium]
MNRRDLLKSASLASLAFLTSARWSVAQAQDGSRIFTLANPTGFPDLDPSTSFSNDGLVLSNVYESLTRYIPGTGDSPAKVEPLLAESWETSADGLSWTFRLRAGVKFHDGTDLTAAAVKGSIDRTVKIGGGAAFIWSAVTAIEAPDPATVVFRLSSPQPLDVIAAAGFAAWIMSPAALDKDNAWFNAGNDGGTGPFRIDRYEPGQRVVASRFTDHWGGVPEGGFDTAVFEVVEDSVLAQSMIEGGQADWTYGLPYDNLDSLMANPDLSVVSNPSFVTLTGFYNTRRAPLDRAKVRQALSLAFPYDDVIQAATAGLGSRAHGVIPAGIWGHDPDAPIPQTDLDAARALLAEEGLADSGLELTMTYATSEPLEAVAGELWKANLETLGITLTLQPMAWEAQWELAKADPTAAQDIFVMYWWPTYVTPYDYLVNLFHSEEAPMFNLGYYSNPAFDKMIDEAAALSGTDRAKAEEMFKAAQRILVEEAAAVFILDTPNIHVLRSDVKGYVDNPAYGHIVFVNELGR